MKNLSITDVKTGEIVSVEKASLDQASEFLSQINLQRRKLEKMEKAIKEYYQQRANFSVGEDGKEVASVGKWRLVKTFRSGFSKKLLTDKGTEKDKKIFGGLEKKYLMATEYISWK